MAGKKRLTLATLHPDSDYTYIHTLMCSTYNMCICLCVQHITGIVQLGCHNIKGVPKPVQYLCCLISSVLKGLLRESMKKVLKLLKTHHQSYWHNGVEHVLKLHRYM